MLLVHLLSSGIFQSQSSLFYVNWISIFPGFINGQGRGRHSSFQTRLDAVVEGFIDKFLLGEPASGGGKAIGSKDREEDGEDLRVAVDENGVGVIDGAG